MGKNFFTELDGLFSAVLNGVTPGYTSLPINMRETDDGWELLSEVPGIKSDHVNITFEDSYMSVVVSKREDGDWDYTELRPMIRSRKIYMPTIDPNKIEAKVEDGILSIKAPKKVKEKSMVSIKVN